MTATAWKFKPIYGVLLVAAVSLLILGADFVYERGLDRPRPERVAAAADGSVHLDVGALGRSQVRFYRYLNAGNQEVLFLVARDAAGDLQVAFDASENDFKLRRGFRQQGDWLINNKCDTAVRLEEVNQGGGCRPVPLRFRVDGSQLVLTESALLEGWRLFR